MGTASTKELKIFQNSNIGNLSVCLDKNYYFPGEEVRGNIWIQLFQDLEVCGLELKVQMQESWSHSNGDSNTKENNIQNLVDISIDIESFLFISEDSFKLREGTYNFPFIQKIPEFVNSSFEFYSYQSNIFLRYVIYSCLLSTKGENFSISNINYLIIKCKPIILDSPLTYSCCRNVHSWLFLEKGTCSLNVSYPKTNFAFQDFINLICTIDNSRCKLKVNYIKVCLFQKIIFKTPFSEITCYENELKRLKLKIECLPGQLISNFPINLQLTNDKINLNIYKSNDNPFMHLLNSPDDIFNFQPSIDSSLISCQYSVRVSLYFDAVVTYGNRPRLIMPITITHEVDKNIISYDFNDVIPQPVNEISHKNFGQMINEIEDINAYNYPSFSNLEPLLHP